MRTVKHIVDDLGGITVVAKAHNPPLAISTVGSWVAANYIPKWRQPEMVRIAATLEKALPLSDFPPKDKRLRVVA